MLLMGKWAIALLLVATAVGATMVSATSVSSHIILNCGTIVYNKQACDLNCDGRINIIDVAMVLSGFGSRLGDERWNPNLDFNGDGQINEVDLLILASNLWRK